MSDDSHVPVHAHVEPEDDPIVAEVRAIREAMFAEVGYDIGRLYERIKEREAAERAAGRVVISPPDRPAGRPEAAA